MKIYILIIASGEYDDYHREVIAVTTNAMYAQAWPIIGYNKTSCTYEVDEFTLDHFEDEKALEAIKSILDPRANPLCECGDSLKEHSPRGKKKCLQCRLHPERSNPCTGFKLAQPLVQQPPLAPRIKL